jgi:hypothetical protein
MAFSSDLIRTKNWGTELLTDTDLEGQLDLIIAWVMASMNSSTGHNHAGTSNQGPKIPPTSLATISSLTEKVTLHDDDLFIIDDSEAANAKKKVKYSNVKQELPIPAFENSILHVRDEKTANTAGGTFTQDAWRTRTLNTVKTNEISGASLGSNQITLPTGTYFIDASAPAVLVQKHKARLYNITDSEDALIGTSEITETSAASTPSKIKGRFTIAAQKVFQIQHYCSVTRSTDGFGIASNIDSKVEVYTEVLIWKVA